MHLDTVNVRIDQGAATIELDRPEALNAWNKQLGEDLLAALTHASEEETVRAVRITGAGRAFSSGADLRDISGDDLTPEGRPNVYGVLTERYHPIMHAIREMGKPVVAAVNGGAVGIGCSLALCCDLGRGIPERLLPARVREHRPGTRRGLLAVRARAHRNGAGRRDGDAGRALECPPGARMGTCQPRVRRRGLRARERGAHHPFGARTQRAPMRRASACSTSACMRAWRSSSNWRPPCSRRWPAATISSRA